MLVGVPEPEVSVDTVSERDKVTATDGDDGEQMERYTLPSKCCAGVEALAVRRVDFDILGI